MHDSPSSTPSTPPALSGNGSGSGGGGGQNPLINPAEHLSLHSPPDTQQTPPASQQGTPLVAKGGGGGGGEEAVATGRGSASASASAAGGGGGGGGTGAGPGGFVPSWASKRAVEDAETAREKLVDGKFSLREFFPFSFFLLPSRMGVC